MTDEAVRSRAEQTGLTPAVIELALVKVCGILVTLCVSIIELCYATNYGASWNIHYFFSGAIFVAWLLILGFSIRHEQRNP